MGAQLAFGLGRLKAALRVASRKAFNLTHINLGLH